MKSESNRPGPSLYGDEQEEWGPEEVEWAMDEAGEPIDRFGVRPPVVRRRSRPGRVVPPRGVVGLLLLVLLAVAIWWGAQMVFFTPEATPTPAAIATLEMTPSPTPIATPTEPVGVVTPQPSPTPTLPAAKIAIGQTVQVSGTGKEGIRLRAGPGLDTITFVIVDEGAKLKVLGGPEEKDGFVWWRLKAEDGTIGWAAENWLRPVAGAD